MKSIAILSGLAVFLFCLSPSFAIGDMNITLTGLSPVYVNSNTTFTAINLTFNVTQSAGDGFVNITAIRINITGAETGNLSFFQLKNAAGASLGVNATDPVGKGVVINITGGFVVNYTANRSMTLVLNTSRYATSGLNISINITASGITTNETGNNITFRNAADAVSNSGVSNGFQMQNLHITGTIAPSYVDAGVENQTFAYRINITGTDPISNIIIRVPSGYTLINLTSVERGSSPGVNLTAGTDYANTTGSNHINITIVGPTTQNFTIYFSANTSAVATVSTLFGLNVSGSNLTNILPDETSIGSLNVTKQNIINVDSMLITKGVAILNDTDYWEFNFTLNFTANVSGIIQFKMTNWTDASGYNLSLTSSRAPGATYSCSLPYCASIRNDMNFSTLNKFNVTNTYETSTKGLAVTMASGNIYTIVLRMVIPLQTPSSATWQTTYGILFRSSP